MKKNLRNSTSAVYETQGKAVKNPQAETASIPMPKTEAMRAEDLVVCRTIVKNATMSNGMMYARIPLHLLHIPRYQRKEQNNVEKIVAHWNDNRCGTILISYRDEKFWIVDGQNRAAAARILRKEDMFCQIMIGLTEEQEIELYAEQNKYVKRIAPYDKLNAYACKEGTVEEDVYKICLAHGVEIVAERNHADGVLSCVETIKSIYKRDGAIALEWVFDAIHDLHWQNAKNGYSRTIVSALGKLYHKQKISRKDVPHPVDAKEVKRRLLIGCGKMSPDQVLMNARQRFPQISGPVSAVSTYLEDLLFPMGQL